MFAGLVLGAALLCPGCGSSVSVETGPGVRARYAWDTLKARLDYPIDKAYRAASEAVQQLDLDVLRQDHDGVAGEVSVLDAQRDHITVELEALPGEQTIMQIRVGLFGDKNKSEVVFEQIVGNLGEEVAATPTVRASPVMAR
jgi:hypothetical protein